jgi:hypothetical protein
MNKVEFLDSVKDTVAARSSYGDVKDNFRRIVDFWNVYLYHRGLLAEGAELDEKDVAMLNDLQKTSRLIATRDHLDSVVDKAGYAATYVDLLPDTLQQKGA